jgi:hypothetical protein
MPHEPWGRAVTFRQAFGAVCLAFAVAFELLPASGKAADLYNNTNSASVLSRPTAPTGFALFHPANVTEIVTYHWNNGRGAAPGTITLRGPGGRVFGPFRARGVGGQNNAPDVNWVADINVTLPAGAYTVVDSDPATWSQNAQSQNRGFAIVRGTSATAAAPPQPPRQPPVPAAQAPNPCHRTSFALLELVNPPCFGPAGTTISLYVLKPLKGPLTTVVFKQGPIGKQWTGRLPPASILVSAPVMLASGNGIAVGSVYRVSVPVQLCTAGRGQWTYDIWPQGGGFGGDVDDFTITGC